MLTPSVLVLLILLASVVLFVSDKLRADLVAMLVLVSLLLFNLVPESEILSGFSSPATITIAAMFVVSAGLQRTGIIRYLANRLHSAVGKGQARLSTVLMVVCGFFSSFTNNTATVSVLLPVALRLSIERGINPGRVLMPLSFAAQFGGVCTLVGTSTNLLVNSIAISHGMEPISMFEFARLGLVCFTIGVIYMIFAGRYLLKDSAGVVSATDEYRLKDYITEMRVLEGSPLIGQKGGESELNDLGVRVLEIIREGKMLWAPQVSEIRASDILLIRGDAGAVMEVEGRLKIEDWAEGNLSDVHLQSDDIGLMEVMVPNGSHVIGRSLTQLDFYWRYHAAVLAVRRRSEVIHERISDISLKEGDTLLLQGHKEDLEHLDDEKDFVLLQDLSVLRLKKRRALLALGIVVFVIAASSLGLLSVLEASLSGALLMLLTRCLRASEAYEAIDMKVILLLAGLIPLGFALQSSGLFSLFVERVAEFSGQYGPYAGLGVIYLLTMLLTALMSNAATAVILTPLAIGLASDFGVDVKPFVMAVAFAASTCFSTPVGYQTNMMVYSPGGYKYLDFVKVGLPLNILFFVVSVTLIPFIWPF